MKRWAGWFLLLCALLPFSASRSYPNVHDDVFLRGPGSLVTDARTTAAQLWRADLFGSVDHPSGQSGFWRPLVLLSYRAEFLVSGGAAAPFAWLGHVSNLLLNALATLALWRLLRNLGLPDPAAMLAAALFAVHPVHAETVAWLAGRSDLGATTMGLLATALLLRPRADATAPVPLRETLAGALLLLAALLFKESAVLLLLLAVLLARRQGRSWPAACAAPALALFAYGLLRAVLFTRATVPGAWMGPASESVRWWTWLTIVPSALRLVIWPGPATPIHPVPPMETWRDPAVLGGAAALLLLAFLCAWAWKRREPALSFALLLITGTLLMLAPWVRFPTGYAEVAAPLYDRYLYAAAAAPGIALAVLLRGWLARAPRFAAVFTLAAVALIGPVAAAAGRVWSSDEAFARAGLAVSPRSADLWNHLGVARLETLHAGAEPSAGDDALAAFDHALALQPTQFQAELNRFITLVLLDRQDDATVAARDLLRHHPADPQALDFVAQWHARHERWKEAADLYGREIATGGPLPGAEAALDDCLRAQQAADQRAAEKSAGSRSDGAKPAGAKAGGSRNGGG